MPALVHTAAEITEMLRRGLTPITDNAAALVDLGFVRAYPQVRNGLESMIWERTSEVGQRDPDGRRRFARERAFLDPRGRVPGRTSSPAVPG